jgi:hypothetical protein
LRRLGDLWTEGNLQEKAFVAKLLLKMAGNGNITNRTWREAEDLWEKTVKDQIDLGKVFP